MAWELNGVSSRPDLDTAVIPTCADDAATACAHQAYTSASLPAWTAFGASAAGHEMRPGLDRR